MWGCLITSSHSTDTTEQTTDCSLSSRCSTSPLKQGLNASGYLRKQQYSTRALRFLQGAELELSRP